MQFPFPYFRILVIPSDAGPTDPRVVIGDPAGSIGIFNSSGDLVGELTPTGPLGEPGFFVYEPGDPTNYVALETRAGFPGITFKDSNATTVGRWSPGRTGSAGTTERFNYTIVTPRAGGSGQARLVMASESEDGTIAPSFAFSGTPSGVADITLNGESLPRGIWDQFSDDAPSATFTTDGVTDMVLTNCGTAKGGLYAGRTYSFTMHALAELSAAAGQWNIFLRRNGANVGRFARLLGSEVQRPMIDSTLYYTPAADTATDDFDVFVDEVAAGADLTLLGTANDLLRTLTCTDEGVL